MHFPCHHRHDMSWYSLERSVIRIHAGSRHYTIESWNIQNGFEIKFSTLHGRRTPSDGWSHTYIMVQKFLLKEEYDEFNVLEYALTRVIAAHLRTKPLFGGGPTLAAGSSGDEIDVRLHSVTSNDACWGTWVSDAGLNACSPYDSAVIWW